MSFLSNVKKNIWIIVTSILGGLAVIFGISYLVKRKETRSLSDDIKISKLKKEVEDIQSKGKVIEANVERDEVEIKNLIESREEVAKKIKEARDTSGMTNDEVLDAFSKLGY